MNSKLISILILTIIPFLGSSQVKEKLQNNIDSLSKVQKQLEIEVSPTLEKIDSIKEQINILNIKLNQPRLEEIDENGIEGSTNMTAKMYKEPCVSDVILKIPENTTIQIFSKHEYYYKVLYDDIYGYVHEISITKDSNLSEVPVKVKVKTSSATPTKRTSTTKYRSSYSSKCNTVRCSGRTKKGNRCGNSTTNCSGRCHLH